MSIYPRPRLRLLLLSLSVVGAIAAGAAVAGGQLFGGGGQLTACAVQASGVMRLVESADDCRQGEVAVSWSTGGGSDVQHARVRADGTLDTARSSAGISLTRILFPTTPPYPTGGYQPIPVNCFDLSAPPDVVVATPETAPRVTVVPAPPLPPGGQDMVIVGLPAIAVSATSDPTSAVAWGCPGGTDAAVAVAPAPDTALNVVFR